MKIYNNIKYIKIVIIKYTHFGNLVWLNNCVIYMF